MRLFFCQWDKSFIKFFVPLLYVLYLDIFCTIIFTFKKNEILRIFPRDCPRKDPGFLGLPVHHQLPEFTQTHVYRVSHAIQPSHPLSSPSPPTPNPSQHHFSNESTLHMRWPKYWSFSFSIIPSKEIPGLIFFRMDWLDLLAVQGTLKSLLQHHSSEASNLRHSAFFTFHLSHPYVTTRKTIALTRWTFVGKVMSLLLNMLSTLVITFLPRSKLVFTWNLLLLLLFLLLFKQIENQGYRS